MEGDFSTSESLSTCNISYEMEDIKGWTGDSNSEYALHIKLKSPYDIVENHKSRIIEVIGEIVGRIPGEILPYSIVILTYFESEQILKLKKDNAKVHEADDEIKNFTSTTSENEGKMLNEYKDDKSSNFSGNTRN